MSGKMRGEAGPEVGVGGEHRFCAGQECVKDATYIVTIKRGPGTGQRVRVCEDHRREYESPTVGIGAATALTGENEGEL